MKSNYQRWIHKFGISTSLLLLAAMIGLPVAAIYRELKKLGIDIYLW